MLSSKKILIILTAAAIITLLLMSGCGGKDIFVSSSGNNMKTIKERGYLKVGCKIDVPSFGYKNPKTNELEGLEIDLARAVAQKIFDDPSKVEFIAVIPKTRGQLLDNGDIDMVIATYTINEERKKQYDFSDQYYRDPIGLLVKQTDNINSLSDLEGKTIAVPQGTTVKKAVEEVVKEAEIEVSFAEFPTYPECKAALMSGRVTAYANDTSILAGYNDDYTKILSDQFAQQEYGIAVKKGNDALVKVINETFKEMNDSGEMDKLLVKWHLN